MNKGRRDTEEIDKGRMVEGEIRDALGRGIRDE